jgi:hypothetical protein
MHSLLDLAALYRDKLKNPAKALDYEQRAFTRYMDNAPLRDAVQPLIEAQYQTAVASFTNRDYKKAAETAGNIFLVYPVGHDGCPTSIPKIQTLVDQSRHLALSVSEASVDLITLSNETLIYQEL